jgi:amino acid transporter
MWRRYKNFIFSGLLIVTVFFSFFLFSPASQAGTYTELYNQMDAAGKKAWGSKPMAGSSSLPDIIRYAVQGFLGLLGIIFIILIIFAGYNWLTAGGDEEKVTKAKQTLTRAVIGLIIIVGAYAITYFVFMSLPGAGGNSAGGG